MVCQSILNPKYENLFLIICSALGILGSLSIIFLQLKYTHLRGYFNTLILYVSFSDLFRSISILIPCSSLSSLSLQSFFGILVQSSFLISVFWSTCIPLTLYTVVILSRSDFEKHHKKWFIIGFVIIPGAMALPLITDSYTNTKRICDLNDGSVGFLWRFTLVYVPSVIFIIISLVVCMKIHCGLKEVSITRQKKRMIRKIILFPIVMCADVLPSVFLHLFEQFVGNCLLNQYNILVLGIFTLNGFFNAVLFAAGNTFKGNKRVSLIKSVKSYNTSSFFSQNLLEESYFPQRHESSLNR